MADHKMSVVWPTDWHTPDIPVVFHYAPAGSLPYVIQSPTRYNGKWRFWSYLTGVLVDRETQEECLSWAGEVEERREDLWKQEMSVRRRNGH
jgi:hypothetical protein